MADLSATPSDAEGLRSEMAWVREDLAASIRELRRALSLRLELGRLIRARPAAAATAFAAGGLLLVLAVRGAVRRRKERRALEMLLEARTRWWLPFHAR